MKPTFRQELEEILDEYAEELKDIDEYKGSQFFHALNEATNQAITAIEELVDKQSYKCKSCGEHISWDCEKCQKAWSN